MIPKQQRNTTLKTHMIHKQRDTTLELLHHEKAFRECFIESGSKRPRDSGIDQSCDAALVPCKHLCLWQEINFLGCENKIQYNPLISTCFGKWISCRYIKMSINENIKLKRKKQGDAQRTRRSRLWDTVLCWKLHCEGPTWPIKAWCVDVGYLVGMKS